MLEGHQGRTEASRLVSTPGSKPIRHRCAASAPFRSPASSQRCAMTGSAHHRSSTALCVEKVQAPILATGKVTFLDNVASHKGRCRFGSNPDFPPWGLHIRFRRVQTLVPGGQSVGQAAQFCLEATLLLARLTYLCTSASPHTDPAAHGCAPPRWRSPTDGNSPRSSALRRILRHSTTRA